MRRRSRGIHRASDAGPGGRGDRQGLSRLGSPPVAVRSSATAEDLADASFAGQQDSFLNIPGDEQVLDAVRRCWASLWNERAMVYRARKRIDPADVAMAVVVQELVDAEASGVMFTADPITGDDSRIEINAVLGLGEAVVSGQAVADSFTVERGTGRVINSMISQKMIMTIRTAIGTADRPVPESRRQEPALDAGRRRHSSRRSGCRIAELYELADGHRMVSDRRRAVRRPGPADHHRCPARTRGTTAGPATSCGPTPMWARPSRT